MIVGEDANDGNTIGAVENNQEGCDGRMLGGPAAAGPCLDTCGVKLGSRVVGKDRCHACCRAQGDGATKTFKST